MWGFSKVPGLNYMSGQVDDALLVGHMGHLTKSERYINAEKALKTHPYIKLVVGHSMGGSVCLELQKHYPRLLSRTYGAPVLDLKGMIPNYSNSHLERYSNYGDPVSMLDRSAYSTLNSKNH